MLNCSRQFSRSAPRKTVFRRPAVHGRKIDQQEACAVLLVEVVQVRYYLAVQITSVRLVLKRKASVTHRRRDLYSNIHPAAALWDPVLLLNVD